MRHRDPQVLSLARLNRSTLARQGLLERTSIDVLTAIERFGGLQAQEPASPYLALRARLAGFRATELDAAFATRSVVKATLMRGTLHAVSALDYAALVVAVMPGFRPLRRSVTDRLEEDASLASARSELLAGIRDFAAKPRNLGELRDYLAGDDLSALRVAAAIPADELVRWARLRLPFIHVPGPITWSFGRRPRIQHATAAVPGARGVSASAAMEHLVRRYLAAFGPASVADVSAWSGVSIGRLRPTIAALEESGALRTDRDEAGRVLSDLAGAPLPEADIHVAARLLPMWDNVLLAFQDRTRLMRDEDRGRVIARNGDTLPSFLVDGRVGGLWWAEADGAGTRIVLEPFRSLTNADARALEAEADALARFIEPLEPRVYARYRRVRG